jgi:hypothetical protein
MLLKKLITSIIALCQDVFEKPQALLPCLHTFCLECVSSIPRYDINPMPIKPFIDMYIREHDSFTCPVCRATINRFVSNYSLQNIIDIFKKAEEYDNEDQHERSTSSTPTTTIESLKVR